MHLFSLVTNLKYSWYILDINIMYLFSLHQSRETNYKVGLVRKIKKQTQKIVTTQKFQGEKHIFTHNHNIHRHYLQIYTCLNIKILIIFFIDILNMTSYHRVNFNYDTVKMSNF